MTPFIGWQHQPEISETPAREFRLVVSASVCEAAVSFRCSDRVCEFTEENARLYAITQRDESRKGRVFVRRKYEEKGTQSKLPEALERYLSVSTTVTFLSLRLKKRHDDGQS